ncbi:hypothetical protein YSA_11102 [Pseudomonas putida ND6]|uniref:Uncharacterized protein n=1 Tax=Pseudomonas putida ND6 TaxID=231023 RepID=I3V4W6_PSEPU|nr:hypothetical protein YSA_11102 [Pseudomonas putida ND6]
MLDSESVAVSSGSAARVIATVTAPATFPVFHVVARILYLIEGCLGCTVSPRKFNHEHSVFSGTSKAN